MGLQRSGNQILSRNFAENMQKRGIIEFINSHALHTHTHTHRQTHTHIYCEIEILLWIIEENWKTKLGVKQCIWKTFKAVSKMGRASIENIDRHRNLDSYILFTYFILSPLLIKTPYKFYLKRLWNKLND